MSDRTLHFPRFLMRIAAAACAALALASCSEEPTQQNSLDSSLPLTNLVVHDTTLQASGSTVFKQYVPMNGAVNLVGVTGGYTAMEALAFYPSTFVSRDTIVVYSARLRLHSAYMFGDTLGSFGFTVYRINREWSDLTTRWDTLQAGFYDASTPRGTYSGFGGPDTQTVVVDLDTAMVRVWLTTNVSTQTTKYGIVLVPSPTSTMVRGFSSFSSDSASYRPTLEIIAGNAANTWRDTTTYNSGLDTFGGNIDNLAVDPTLMYIQSGVAYRSSLSFNVSSIPRGAIINSADLELHRSPTASRLNRFTVDTAVVAHLRLSTDSTLESSYTSAKARGSATYGFDVRHAVQIWTRGTNYGLILRAGPSSEYSSFDLFAFYNQLAPDPALRPRLKIIYSVAKP